MCNTCTKTRTDTTPLRDEPTPELVDAIESVITDIRDETLAAMKAKPFGKQFAYVSKDIEDDVIRMLRAWGVLDHEAHASLFDERTRSLLGSVQNASVRGGLAWVLAVRPDIADTIPLEPDPDDDSDLPAEFGRGNPEAARILARREVGTREGFVGVSETIAENMFTTLSEGVAQGDNIDKLSNRVRAEFDAEAPSGERMSRARAERIARTETAYAQNEGQTAGAKASGLRIRKVWRLAPNACPRCEAMAREFGPSGKAVDIDGAFLPKGSTLRATDGSIFNVSYRDVRGAPLHPHCRCDIEMIVDGVDRPVRRPGT